MAGSNGGGSLVLGGVWHWGVMKGHTFRAHVGKTWHPGKGFGSLAGFLFRITWPQTVAVLRIRTVAHQIFTFTLSCKLILTKMV